MHVVVSWVSGDNSKALLYAKRLTFKYLNEIAVQKQQCTGQIKCAVAVVGDANDVVDGPCFNIGLSATDVEQSFKQGSGFLYSCERAVDFDAIKRKVTHVTH